MAASDLLLRVQELGGSWQPIGSEKARGIWLDPSSFSADADLWGSRQLQAQLRYDPRVLQPHISAFTPWELEIGGIQYASGRVKETPSQDGSDRSVTLTGEGWQYHLDDDAYQRMYVHTALSDWQDAKQGLSTDLAVADYAASGSVSTDQQGLIVLSYPNTTVISTGSRVGVYIDLGPDSTASAISVDWFSSNNTALNFLNCRGMDVPQFGTQDTTFGFTAAWSAFANNTGTSGTVNGTFSTPRRYIVIFDATSSGYTAGADVWWKLAGIRLFGSGSYQSSGASILVGSTIVADAIARATILLSSDQSQITPTTFVLPEYAMSGYQSPRDVATSALSFDDVIPRITVGMQLSIRARPQLPIYEVGDWSGAEFQDASTNSGDDIYNSVVVTGTDATGSPIVVRRAQVPSFFTPSAIQLSNPSAATNATGWAATGGATLSRDTVTFDTTPGSFKAAIAAAGDFGLQTASWSGGSFVPGQTYQLTIRMQTTGAFSAIAAFVTDANGATLAYISPGTPGSWATKTLTFTPQTSGSPTFGIAGSAGSAATIWVDTLSLQQGAATLVDRRGFRKTYRLDTNMSLTTAAAVALGDVFLASHRYTPFKGTLNLIGPGAIRRIRGGQSVTMGELLQNTGELIQFSHLVDPDTGGLGRYGRIASVSLSGPWTASVQIDSTNDNLQALLNRFQVNAAQIR